MNTPPLTIETIERRSKQAMVMTIVGIVVLLGTLVYGFNRLAHLREETIQVQQQLQNSTYTLQAKKAELATVQKSLEQLDTQLSFRQKVYSQLVAKKQIQPAAITNAADEAFQENPKLADVNPSVVIHISKQEQRAKAEELATKIKAMGFQVSPDIEFVGTKAPNSSQLRYFFRSDKGPELEKIEKVLQESGISAKEQFIGLQQNPPNLKPKQFEVWLGLDYSPNS
jgi:hypothetical protein